MTDSMGRRAFLSLSGGAVLLAASRTGLAAEATGNVGFTPRPDQDDAAIFAAARREFLFPTDVAYCNTGTLGAMPREVLDAQTNELRRLEAELPDWPYYTQIGAPLTGYQPREDIRADVGSFMGADMDEIALTQNATMSMNFLANGMTYNAGDEILFTDQEHGGGFGPFRWAASPKVLIHRIGHDPTFGLVDHLNRIANANLTGLFAVRAHTKILICFFNNCAKNRFNIIATAMTGNGNQGGVSQHLALI